jgi:hypothetical protein
MIVLAVETLMLLHFQVVSVFNRGPDFVFYQWFIAFWTADGRLPKGLAWEVMKINLLFAVYAWVMARAMVPDKDIIHRWSLASAALLLLVYNLMLLRSADMALPWFTLTPIEP